MIVSNLLYSGLFALFCAINLSNGRECPGTNIESLEANCTTIVNSSLIIKGKVTKDALKKLLSVKRIKKGIVINETITKKILFSLAIKSIENDEGYAIIFNGNKNLVRFRTHENMNLSGKTKAVYFENDNFYRTAAGKKSTSGEALADFAHLALAAAKARGGYYDWYEVKPGAEPSWNLGHYIHIAVAVALTIIAAVVLCVCKCKKEKDVEHGKKASRRGSASITGTVANSKTTGSSIAQPLSKTSNSVTKSLVNPPNGSKRLSSPTQPNTKEQKKTK